ncbi:MAG: hypothetical protein LBP31_00110 [Holosporales bacterium]|jgi:TolA-binding protein|nr:hypothetical protein [Holosporales bacterium]
MKSYEFIGKNTMTTSNKSVKKIRSIVNEEIGKECLCSEKFFDKKLITMCLLSAAISGICVIGVFKITMYSKINDLQKTSQNCQILEEKMQKMEQKISSVTESFETFQKDLKSNRETLEFACLKIASTQKDIAAIKNEYHVTEKVSIQDVDLKNLSSEDISFLESLGSLISEGAPFAEFLKSRNEKIDITKYSSGKKLMEFADKKIPSVSDLKKEILNVGQSEFDISLTETFWEKQKRIVKEKIVSSVKITDSDDNNNQNVVSKDAAQNNKLVFTEASEHMKDGRVEEALVSLEKIQQHYPDLNKFIKNAKQRVALEKVFSEFKKEFVEALSTKKSDEKKRN